MDYDIFSCPISNGSCRVRSDSNTCTCQSSVECGGLSGCWGRGDATFGCAARMLTHFLVSANGSTVQTLTHTHSHAASNASRAPIIHASDPTGRSGLVFVRVADAGCYIYAFCMCYRVRLLCGTYSCRCNSFELSACRDPLRICCLFFFGAKSCTIFIRERKRNILSTHTHTDICA